MKTTPFRKIVSVILCVGCMLMLVESQALNAPANNRINDKLIIDSLQNVILMQADDYARLDLKLKKVEQSNAELKNRVAKMEDYKQKLEGNVSSFKGENLKLNQSNRILIIFNSLVAVLLLVTLVFFLKRIGKKKQPAMEMQPLTVVEKTESPAKFMNFEDKLQQLERLGNLKDKGFLSEDEFVSEKHTILGK